MKSSQAFFSWKHFPGNRGNFRAFLEDTTLSMTQACTQWEHNPDIGVLQLPQKEDKTADCNAGLHQMRANLQFSRHENAGLCALKSMRQRGKPFHAINEFVFKCLNS